MNDMDNLKISDSENWEWKGKTIFNYLGLFVSLITYGLLIGYLTNGINKNDKERIKATIGVLISFGLIGMILAFTNIDLFIKNREVSWVEYLKPFLLCISGVPYIIFDFLNLLGNKVIGKNKKTTLENMDLDTLGKKYSGGLFTRFKGDFGKRDSGFMILDSIRIGKREGILPCNPYKGVCRVRRSVIYMTFYLTAIILVPLIITFAEMSGGNKKFKIKTFMTYLNSFLAGTLALVLIFVLGTIKDAAGSDVFTGSTVEKNIREQSEVKAPAAPAP